MCTSFKISKAAAPRNEFLKMGLNVCCAHTNYTKYIMENVTTMFAVGGNEGSVASRPIALWQKYIQAILVCMQQVEAVDCQLNMPNPYPQGVLSPGLQQPIQHPITYAFATCHCCLGWLRELKLLHRMPQNRIPRRSCQSPRPAAPPWQIRRPPGQPPQMDWAARPETQTPQNCLLTPHTSSFSRNTIHS